MRSGPKANFHTKLREIDWTCLTRLAITVRRHWRESPTIHSVGARLSRGRLGPRKYLRQYSATCARQKLADALAAITVRRRYLVARVACTPPRDTGRSINGAQRY
jgi:hypothetical protein